MIEGIIAVSCFMFIGFACIFLGFGWLSAEKKYKAKIAELEDKNAYLERKVERITARERFYKNELEKRNEDLKNYEQK